MVLAQLECDGPIRAEIGVRALEEPEAEDEADGARDEQCRIQRVLGE